MHEQDDAGGELAVFVAPAKAGDQIPCRAACPRPLDPGFRRDDERGRRLDLTNRRFANSINFCRHTESACVRVDFAGQAIRA